MVGCRRRHRRPPATLAAAAAPDLNALWEEHIATEFDEKCAKAAVATMVPHATVNHVPVMTGGPLPPRLRCWPTTSLYVASSQGTAWREYILTAAVRCEDAERYAHFTGGAALQAGLEQRRWSAFTTTTSFTSEGAERCFCIF